MEIVGGSGRRRERLATKGLDAFLLAEPAPGAEIGGDVQYASMCSAGKISRFAVADVSGHGDLVAGFGLALRDLMRKFINTPNQERMIQRLNDSFSEMLDSGPFATAVLVTWFEPTRQAYVCTAGHPSPLWYNASLDQWIALDPESFGAVDGGSGSPVNLPLGIVEGTAYRQFTVPVGQGDLLALFTDHYLEARSASGEMPGPDGLRRMCESCRTDDPEAFAEDLEAGFAGHLADVDVEDDRSLLVIRADEDSMTHVGYWSRLRGLLRSVLPEGAGARIAQESPR